MPRIIEHFKKNSAKYGFSLGFLFGLAMCLLAGDQLAKVSIPGVGELETREQNDFEHLRSVSRDAERWAAYLHMLADKNVFEINDPRIANAVTNLCDPFPTAPLEAYLSAARECANRPVLKRLRELAQQQSIPFHPSGREVTIGIPAQADQPPTGGANTCQNGEWYRRQVLLTNPLDGRQVTVSATGHYGQGICGPIVGAADFQLNEEDAFKIFDGPMDKFENAVAMIVN